MKSLLKKFSHIVFALLVAPLTLSFWTLSHFLNMDSLLSSYSQFLSLLPGKIGVYMRAGFYRFVLIDFAADAYIGFNVLFSHIDTSIEPGVYIGPQSNIGKCHIAKDCLLGSSVHVLSGKSQHKFDDVNAPIREQGGLFQKITIEEDSWIGNGALIMANVGKKCVVAAGSVVINDVPDFAIVAGNPAKVIRSRKKE